MDPIEEALQELGLFRDTRQPPPDPRMLRFLGLTPGECEHGVPTLHPCLSCRKAAA
jgi:hypothetical protein